MLCAGFVGNLGGLTVAGNLGGGLLVAVFTRARGFGTCLFGVERCGSPPKGIPPCVLNGRLCSSPLKVHCFEAEVVAVAAVLAPPLLAFQGDEQSPDSLAMLGWEQLLGLHGLLVCFPLVLGLDGRKRHFLLLLLLLLLSLRRTYLLLLHR